jgi:hypothetical protein
MSENALASARDKINQNIIYNRYVKYLASWFNRKLPLEQKYSKKIVLYPNNKPDPFSFILLLKIIKIAKLFTSQNDKH